MKLLQIILATLAFVCALVSTIAMIVRGDALVGIIAYSVITIGAGGLLYMSYEEFKQ